MADKILEVPFPFENLIVYRKAVSFARDIDTLVPSMKGKASYSFRDQLSRAATSIPLNIAEGSGRWRRREMAQFFRIARGSAFECVPILQMAYEKGLINENKYQALYLELEELGRMLTSLVRSSGG